MAAYRRVKQLNLTGSPAINIYKLSQFAKKPVGVLVLEKYNNLIQTDGKKRTSNVLVQPKSDNVSKSEKESAAQRGSEDKELHQTGTIINSHLKIQSTNTGTLLTKPCFVSILGSVP